MGTIAPRVRTELARERTVDRLLGVGGAVLELGERQLGVSQPVRGGACGERTRTSASLPLRLALQPLLVRRVCGSAVSMAGAASTREGAREITGFVVGAAALREQNGRDGVQLGRRHCRHHTSAVNLGTQCLCSSALRP
jgi:hypothetical protein